MCYYTIRARFPHVPNENCLTTAELQWTLTCTERVREKGREGGGAILTTIQTSNRATKKQSKSNVHCQTKVTDSPCPYTILRFIPLREEGRMLQEKRGENFKIISVFGYSAVLRDTAVFRRVDPARHLQSVRLAPRAQRPPCSGAHNAVTVNC